MPEARHGRRSHPPLRPCDRQRPRTLAQSTRPASRTDLISPPSQSAGRVSDGLPARAVPTVFIDQPTGGGKSAALRRLGVTGPSLSQPGARLPNPARATRPTPCPRAVLRTPQVRSAPPVLSIRAPRLSRHPPVRSASYTRVTSLREKTAVMAVNPSSMPRRPKQGRARVPAQRRRAATPLLKNETARRSRASSADPLILIGMRINGKIQHLCLRFRAGHDAARQTHDVIRDLARPREPHMPTVNVRPNMLKRAS